MGTGRATEMRRAINRETRLAHTGRMPAAAAVRGRAESVRAAARGRVGSVQAPTHTKAWRRRREIATSLALIRSKDQRNFLIASKIPVQNNPRPAQSSAAPALLAAQLSPEPLVCAPGQGGAQVSSSIGPVAREGVRDGARAALRGQLFVSCLVQVAAGACSKQQRVSGPMEVRPLGKVLIFA